MPDHSRSAGRRPPAEPVCTPNRPLAQSSTGCLCGVAQWGPGLVAVVVVPRPLASGAGVDLDLVHSSHAVVVVVVVGCWCFDRRMFVVDAGSWLNSFVSVVVVVVVVVVVGGCGSCCLSQF